MGHTATQQAGSGGLTATEHRLDNGLRLVLSEDHLTPVAAVCLWYDVGSRHEVEGRTGLAHLFEHLMFQGSAQVKGNGHFELVQGAGGSLNGTTSFERTNYFETMPAHQLELALWLEADRMGSLLAALDEESLQNQRDVVKNERRQRYDNVPYGTAFERMTALAYPEGHPYHHTPIGSMADLDAATLDDARAFFRANYAPNNAVLAVVGDIDPEQTLRWVEKYFGSIPSYDGKVPPRDGTLPDIIGAELREEIQEEVPARALMAAYRMPRDGTRECDAAELALTVLGDGMSSRLYNRLVRRDRTAITAGFGLLRLAGAPSLGWLDVKASGGAEIPQIEAAVDEELARLARGGAGRRGDGAGAGPAGTRMAGPARYGRRPGRRTVPVRGAVRRPAARVHRRQPDPRRHRRGGPGGGRRAAAPRQPRGAGVRAGDLRRDTAEPGRATRPAQPMRTTSRTEPGGDRRSRDHGLPPPAGARAGEALGVPRTRARRPRPTG